MWIEILRLLATVAFGLATTALALLALKYTREKARLDLYEKRLAFYNRLWKGLSLATTANHPGPDSPQDDLVRYRKNSGKIQDALSHFSYHESRALFGPDVWSFMDEMRAAELSLRLMQSTRPPNTKADDELFKKQYLDASNTLFEGVNRMPDVFAPYLDFGRMRRADSFRAFIRQELSSW